MHGNPARGLYVKLGFESAGQDADKEQMIWRTRATRSLGPGENAALRRTTGTDPKAVRLFGTVAARLQRRTPAPLTPAPLTPAPLTPAPLTPAPLTPAPLTPAPLARSAPLRKAI